MHTCIIPLIPSLRRPLRNTPKMDHLRIPFVGRYTEKGSKGPKRGPKGVVWSTSKVWYAIVLDVRHKGLGIQSGTEHDTHLIR